MAGGGHKRPPAFYFTMKFVYPALFVSVIATVFAADPPAKPPVKPPAKTTQAKTAPARTTKAAPKTAAPKAAVAAKPTAKSRSSVSHTTSASRNAKGARRPVTSTVRSRQSQPTPERYKEIQQALADKGYLKAEPTGVWDSQSVEALQRFQTDRKLQVTGKINAPSLIDLGLGPKTAALTPPPEPPVPDAK